LYFYWRSISVIKEDESKYLEPRFARSHSSREFFALTDIEQCRPFWNLYASGLAGDALFSPTGQLWQSDDELLEKALARLEQLAFVGISEDMTGSMDALCRRLDIPNLYVGQFDNITPRQDPTGRDSQVQDDTSDIDEECLDLIRRANALDMVVYDRAMTIALGDRERMRPICCLPGQMPSCRVRNHFAEQWVENRAGGFIVFGPYTRLLPGRYGATFRLRVRSSGVESWSGGSLGYLDVIARAGNLLLARHELPEIFCSSGDVSYQLTFDVNHVLNDAEFRVWAEPGAPFDVDLKVSLRHI
jgi:hypothetical protein